MFATAIDPTLSKLTYSEFLGQGTITSIAVGPMNRLYLGGTGTPVPSLLRNAPVSDVTSGGMYFELDQSGTPVTISEFGGHAISEVPNAMSVDPSGNIYFTATSQSVTSVAHFRFPFQFDLISAGSGFGSSTGTPFAIISPGNSPQISLNTVGPFLNMRDAGSADLHISNITVGGGLAKTWGTVEAQSRQARPAS